MLNHNYIEKIPEKINEMNSLKILKATHNRILVIPFLRNIRHLELDFNPIKLITTQFKKTNIQYLSFDWIFFLSKPEGKVADLKNIDLLQSYLDEAVNIEVVLFIEFHPLF